jgi:thioredoxin-like negative regulator of GroEL
LKYQGLAQQKSDWIAVDDSKGDVVRNRGQVRFASIEFGANMALCRALQIRKLPTIHLYRRGRKLAGFPCGPAKFRLLQDTIDYYVSRVAAVDNNGNNMDGISKAKGEDSLEETLAMGNALMNSPEVTSALLEDAKKQSSGNSKESLLVEQQLATTKTKNSGNKRKRKSWWRRLLA